MSPDVALAKVSHAPCSGCTVLNLSPNAGGANLRKFWDNLWTFNADILHIGQERACAPFCAWPN
jgi:hypothetical protein